MIYPYSTSRYLIIWLVISGLSLAHAALGQGEHLRLQDSFGNAPVQDLRAQQKYEGCVSGNCSNGKGAYYYSRNRAMYNGEFIDDTPTGYGECFYANGESYQGHWVNGYFHGHGTLKLTNGKHLKGKWKDGQLVHLINEQNEQDSNTVPHQTEEKSENRAIIIGISNCPNMPSLKYADDDAYQMYAFLKSPAGGAYSDDEILLLIDEAATKDNIRRAFHNLEMLQDSLERLFVYYSGHGKDSHFIPYDYDGDSHRLTHKELNNWIDAQKFRQKYIIVDACHSGNAFAYKGSPLRNHYKSFIDVKDKGTAIFLSSKEEETSIESEGLRQGVFSHYFLKGIEGRADANADGKISIGELQDFVYHQVSAYTGGGQSPRYMGGLSRESIISTRFMSF